MSDEKSSLLEKRILYLLSRKRKEKGFNSEVRRYVRDNGNEGEVVNFGSDLDLAKFLTRLIVSDGLKSEIDKCRAHQREGHLFNPDEMYARNNYLEMCSAVYDFYDDFRELLKTPSDSSSKVDNGKNGEITRTISSDIVRGIKNDNKGGTPDYSSISRLLKQMPGEKIGHHPTDNQRSYRERVETISQRVNGKRMGRYTNNGDFQEIYPPGREKIEELVVQRGIKFIEDDLRRHVVGGLIEKTEAHGNRKVMLESYLQYCKLLIEAQKE